MEGVGEKDSALPSSDRCHVTFLCEVKTPPRTCAWVFQDRQERSPETRVGRLQKGVWAKADRDGGRGGHGGWAVDLEPGRPDVPLLPRDQPHAGCVQPPRRANQPWGGLRPLAVEGQQSELGLREEPPLGRF